MKSKRCTIFIPLFNEEDIVRENTDRLLSFMAERKLPCEIILGSNGSTDSTFEIIQKLEREKPNIKAFHLTEKSPGRAFVFAVRMASNEFIVSQDIDLSADLEFIPLALEFLKCCEIVLGCKRLQFQKRPLIRRLGSNFFIFVVATVLGIATADFSIGAKAYRRSFVLKHSNRLDNGTAYVLELVYYAILGGAHVVEFPVRCEDWRSSRFNILAEAAYKFDHLFRFAWHHYLKRNEEN